jgi:hypothetical protein
MQHDGAMLAALTGPAPAPTFMPLLQFLNYSFKARARHPQSIDAAAAAPSRLMAAPSLLLLWRRRRRRPPMGRLLLGALGRPLL